MIEMLIGIGGATLSGKTTVSQRLNERLSDMGFSSVVIPEFAREVAKKMGYKKVDDIRRNPLDYFRFELEVLKMKVKMESDLIRSYDFVICDSTVAEVYLYSKLYLPSNLSRKISGIVRRYIDRYDVVFLLQPLNVYVDDGFRSLRDIAERSKHYEILKKIYNNRFTELPATTAEKRVERILNEILSRKSNSSI